MALCPVVAVASPYTEVASAFDDGDAFDLNLTLDYGFVLQRAEIKREWNRNFLDQGQMVSATDPLPEVKDLLFEGSRHLVVPRLSIGLFRDISFTAAVPVVIANQSKLKFDDRGSLQVVRDNSSTIIDGLLPRNGFDASDPAAGFAEGSTIFRSPTRAGLDQVHLGLAWAAMNQDRDATKPTWKLGAEARVAVGSPMRLNRTDPNSESSVGRGVHEVRVWTSIAKRAGWAEPFFEVWWLAPFATNSDSPFDELGFGQNRAASQQQAGTRFGFQAVMWQRPQAGHRISLTLSGRLEANFEGRAYTPMWEVFQFAGDAAVDPNAPLVLDSNPVQDGRQVLSHPGITTVENFLIFGGGIGLETAIGQLIRFGASADLRVAQDHVITFSDAGVDGDDDDNRVNPGTDEVNPTHVALIDQVGNRYRLEESVDLVIVVDVRLLF